MRVCMVAYTFYETDNRVRRYAETLVKRGDEVDAIVLRRNYESSSDTIRGVRIHRIQKRVIDEGGPLSYLVKLLSFLIRSTWLLTVLHLRDRYDVIHVHSVPDFEVFCTIIPRLMGARVILDIHDIVPELYASKFKIDEHSIAFKLLVWMERLSIRYANHVIVANHLWHDRLLRRSTVAEHCTAILNYPDPSIFYQRAVKSSDDAEFVMCYPGTLSWHQGVDLVISAMALLRDRAPNLRFLVFGDGPERERLEAMIKELGLSDRIAIGGGVSIEQVAQVMASVDLGVEPKRVRSFGNEALSTKILEFMAMDVPVLASQTRINRLYFNDDLVQFFDSESIDDLAANILQLMRNPAKRELLRRNGLEFIQRNNWDVKMHQYLELVDRLALPPAPGPAISSLRV